MFRSLEHTLHNMNKLYGNSTLQAQFICEPIAHLVCTKLDFLGHTTHINGPELLGRM